MNGTTSRPAYYLPVCLSDCLSVSVSVSLPHLSGIFHLSLASFPSLLHLFIPFFPLFYLPFFFDVPFGYFMNFRRQDKSILISR